MKVVILAGGYGTRISEESQFLPKPMIEIGGGKPILWHIMKLFSFYGFNEFIICAGYKQESIKKYFSDYFLNNSDVTFDFSSKTEKVLIHAEHVEPWTVSIIDTGLNTMTGGRIKRVREHIGSEPFLMTYGDGLANVNVTDLIKFHKSQKHLATLTAVMPEGRFGVMDIDGNMVKSFREKAKKDTGWINGGFMVLEPQIFDYIESDNTMFEREPLERLAKEGELACYKHSGFWQCMDTLKDKQKLKIMWEEGNAPWKVW